MKISKTYHQAKVAPLGDGREKAHSEIEKSEVSSVSQADRVSLSKVSKPSFKLGAAEMREVSEGLAFNSALESALPPTLSAGISASFQSGFVDTYLTPQSIQERTRALAAEFPDLVQVIDTGFDTHGYDGSNKAVRGPSDLVYLRLGPQTSERDNKVGVFQYAAPHARERVNPMTMMELTEQLVRNYDPESSNPQVRANTKLLQELDVFVAINTNPDGHNFAAFDDPMWRKNRAPVPGGAKGVDINRNYPYEWEPSRNPRGQTYSGSGPASEAETKSLLKVVEAHPNIKYVVDWHSHGEEIRRPLNVTAGDSKVYDELHGRVQKAIGDVAGTNYETVVSRVTRGTSDDHFYKVNGIFSTVMETGTSFTPREDEALSVMRESVAGAREFLQVASEQVQKGLVS